MSCYQTSVYVPQENDLGEDVGGQFFNTGCHQSYVDTVSEAIGFIGWLNVETGQCVTYNYNDGGSFSFVCVDSDNGSFAGDVYFDENIAPTAPYTGAHVAFIKGGSNAFGSLPDYPQQKGSNMLCVTTGEGGALVVQNPQPANLSECGMVVLSGSEAMGNPFALSSEAGAAIAVAIITVWAVAFGCRAAIQTLFLKGSTNDESSA
ncbi:hypothetical protein [Methyloversatilis sp. XJ19-49]|uniref:hypothetical protein n=1 Tax=Methyloversatilis sp. XJ19-49 TaxID=2963429 RepID=UPI00211CFEB6|nr:hypothetical protein [Methyloversatilis sp. XJ19-49]MCQ9378317.1 hypothetical protein [Methyloversatilis sp. XJ19-49]